MAVSNIGAQQITFKYSTPLQAEYLNIMLSGSTSEGLCTRPKITTGSVSGSGESATCDITIYPFSMIIHPSDDDIITGESGVSYNTRTVKVTTQENVILTVSAGTRAIGFKYSFRADTHQTVTQWYGDWEVLSQNDLFDYEGIIIATTIIHTTAQNATCSVTTQGADISDFLLREEGWDCNRWVSLISPRRLGGSGKFDKLELRKHNEAFSGFINGHAGCVKQENLTIEIPSGDAGYMDIEPNLYTRYNLIKHNSEGLSWAQRSDTMPIEKTDGGILAIYDATIPNQGAIESRSAYTYSNLAKIHPCVREEINIYLDDETLVLR